MDAAFNEGHPKAAGGRVPEAAELNEIGRVLEQLLGEQVSSSRPWAHVSTTPRGPRPVSKSLNRPGGGRRPRRWARRLVRPLLDRRGRLPGAACSTPRLDEEFLVALGIGAPRAAAADRPGNAGHPSACGGVSPIL